jgi:uncharacterized protein YhfF
MSARQLVAVQFNPWDQRSYTYHNDGEPVAVGDQVRVLTTKGEKIVTVAALPQEQPTFETKPIVGKHVEIEESPGQ